LNLIAHQLSDIATVTKHLIKYPSIKKVNFTGLTAVRKIIARLASENLKLVLLELGGKVLVIVLDDADLEKCSNRVCYRVFLT
jgi:acyl-CoA reductase-like NAD-dependent aldehyde dehydrogenase